MNISVVFAGIAIAGCVFLGAKWVVEMVLMVLNADIHICDEEYDDE